MTMGDILGDDDAQFPIVQPRDLDLCISVPCSQEVGVVGASGEGDQDVLGSDLDGGLISHEFFEECAGLGGFHSPPDPLGQESVECIGHECELEIHFNFEGDCRAERIHVKEVNGIGQCVFDDHAPGVSVNQLTGMFVHLIGDQQRWLVMSEVQG